MQIIFSVLDPALAGSEQSEVKRTLDSLCPYSVHRERTKVKPKSANLSFI